MNTVESDAEVSCNWPRCNSPRTGKCFAWCKCRCHDTKALRSGADELADLLGSADDEPLIEVISRAIQDAQTQGRVEYKRRVGYVGRQTMAATILWRLREHDRVIPPGCCDRA